MAKTTQKTIFRAIKKKLRERKWDDEINADMVSLEVYIGLLKINLDLAKQYAHPAGSKEAVLGQMKTLVVVAIECLEKFGMPKDPIYKIRRFLKRSKPLRLDPRIIPSRKLK